MAEVQLLGLSKSFGFTQALHEVSLTVEDGSMVVLLGPTGAGKTTLLRLVAGLEHPDQGSVHIAGQSMNGEPPAVRDVSFVFQQYSLYPHLSVYDNLAFPLRSPARRQPREQVEQRVREVAALLRIEHKLTNRATRLSGGEMQRVAIGRALVRQPSVYLMDEPLSSLDARLRADLRLELKRIQRELGATILYVTHDQIEAMTMASRIGVLSEGRLIQVGTPQEIYEDPDSTYVATRLGLPQINLLPVATLPAPQAPPGTALLGVRTEHVKIHSGATRGTPAMVQRVERLGDQTHLHLNLGEQTMTVLTDAHSPIHAGQQVGLELHQPLYFDAAGQRLRLST